MAGAVPNDPSTLKSERAGVKAVPQRAVEDVTTVMPAEDPPAFIAPSHTVQTEKRCASFSPLKLWGFQMPYAFVRHFLKLRSL